MNERVASSAVWRARSSRSMIVSFIRIIPRIEKARRLDAAKRLKAAGPARDGRYPRRHACASLSDLHRQRSQARAPPCFECVPVAERPYRRELLQSGPGRAVRGNAQCTNLIRTKLGIGDRPHRYIGGCVALRERIQAKL